MTTRSLVANFIRLLPAVLVLVLCLHAVPGFGETVQQSSLPPDSRIYPYSLPLFSDFDSDDKVDQAELSSDGSLKRVVVTFGKSSWKTLSFDSGVPDRGRLISEDVDNDGDSDLVWVSQSYPQKLVTWFNDGRGNFLLAGELDPNLHRLQAQLEAGESRLTDNSTGFGLACILLTAGSTCLPRVAYGHCINSSKRSRQPTHTLAVPKRFMSVLRKRGPPSRLS